MATSVLPSAPGATLFLSSSPRKQCLNFNVPSCSVSSPSSDLQSSLAELRCARGSWSSLLFSHKVAGVRNRPLRAPPCLASSSSTDSDAVQSKPRVWPLPSSVDDSIVQAQAACRRAFDAGEKRLRLDLLLPLIGATELDDWPGGIQQQYKAASPLAISILKGILGNQVDCKLSIVDDSDAVAEFANEKVALLLFATAETISRLEELASPAGRPLLLVNPQWQAGQVISDFGFGGRRKAAEALVESFTTVYSLRRTRIMSEDVIVFKCYPSSWQVFVGDSSGGTTCVATEGEPPSYKRLEAILRESRGQAGERTWMQRLVAEFNFNRDSMK